jgi:hypothetical protein
MKAALNSSCTCRTSNLGEISAVEFIPGCIACHEASELNIIGKGQKLFYHY